MRFLVALVALLMASCSILGPKQAKEDLAQPDATFTRLFQRDSGGWTGGDGAYSIALPDGRSLWAFGDSFLGTVAPDGSRSTAEPLVRNTLVVQDGAHLTTLDIRLTPDDPNSWYWPLDGTIQNGQLILLLEAFQQTDSGMWGFTYVGQVDAAIFSLPDLQLQDIVAIDHNPRVVYGAAILETEGYTYLYGVEETDGWHKYLHAARTRDILGMWEYYDGQQWTTDPNVSARLFDGVSNQFSVIEWQHHYILITQDLFFSPEILAYRSATPLGPWTDRTVIYRTPESNRPNLFTYNAVAHPEFMDGESLLISYNVNSSNFADLFADTSIYRPRFIRVNLNDLFSNDSP